MALPLSDVTACGNCGTHLHLCQQGKPLCGRELALPVPSLGQPLLVLSGVLLLPSCQECGQRVAKQSPLSERNMLLSGVLLQENIQNTQAPCPTACRAAPEPPRLSLQQRLPKSPQVTSAHGSCPLLLDHQHSEMCEGFTLQGCPRRGRKNHQESRSYPSCRKFAFQVGALPICSRNGTRQRTRVGRRGLR